MKTMKYIVEFINIRYKCVHHICKLSKSNCLQIWMKGERSISLAVRAHKSLELSEDKFYFLTCEQSGYKNVRLVYISYE